METLDTGYMSGFSWRIINGETPYQDFIYKFPPVTIYLHSFFMRILPESGQFLCFRVIDYLFYAVQIYFVIDGIFKLYDGIKISKWALMIVCFLVSWNNFSPYPWPTTDGIFFASLAFWIVCKYKTISPLKIVIISFFCLISALSKQSFYMIPLVFLIWIYVRYSFSKSIHFLIVTLFLLSFFYIFINTITSWSNFANQTNGELRLYDLYYVGFHNYILISIEYFVILISFCLTITITYLYYQKWNFQLLKPFFKWLSFILMGIAIILFIIKKVDIAAHIAFDATIVALFYSYFFKNKKLSFIMPLLVLLSIAWGVSISLGYPSPMLFGTGIIMSFIVIMENEIKLNQKYYFWIGLPICAVAFSFNENPYREDSVFKLHYSLDSISPKLKYIKTKKATFEKHLELKNLIKKYGENFIVAPSFPQANYIFNHQSELPSDWLIETEVNRQMDKLIRLASNPKNYIFIEKSFLNHEDFVRCTTPEFSSIAWFIHTKFNQLEETNHFIIYNQIKKNEKLP
jgi:hypothetical protein